MGYSADSRTQLQSPVAESGRTFGPSCRVIVVAGREVVVRRVVAAMVVVAAAVVTPEPAPAAQIVNPPLVFDPSLDHVISSPGCIRIWDGPVDPL